jgi:hypothetical protein
MNPIKIIPGYLGIMDLDVTHMEQKHTKQAIDQHYNDIKKYKAEQELLKPEDRYENTIVRLNKQREYFCMKEKALSDAIAKAALERNIQYNIRKKITYGFVPIINGSLRH